MWIKQLCNRKVRDFAMALWARKDSGAFEKQAPGPRNLKTQQSTQQWICVWRKLGQGNHVIIAMPPFAKRSVFQKVLRSHQNAKAAFINPSGLKSVFRNAPCSCPTSVVVGQDSNKAVSWSFASSYIFTRKQSEDGWRCFGMDFTGRFQTFFHVHSNPYCNLIL